MVLKFFKNSGRLKFGRTENSQEMLDQYETGDIETRTGTQGSDIR